jgi:TIR domain
MPSIFISYRRDDTGPTAGRLADALLRRFGRGSVFIDIDAIDPGVDFEQRIRSALDSCQLALVLIGQRWLTAEGPDGKPRIGAEGDLVRVEVETALTRPDVTVVPVLVDGATMPSATVLPPEIASLTKYNAFDLTTKRWQYDVDQLMRFTERFDRWWWRLVFRTPRTALRLAPLVAVALAGAVAVAVASSSGGPTKAAQIAECERTHAVAAAEVTRPPRPGETSFSRSQVHVIGSPVFFQQQTFASCTWPPAPGADTDGYRAITVTTTNGSPAVGRDIADVIESRCKRLELMYAWGHMGVEERVPPFTAENNDIWAPSGSLAMARIDRVFSATAPQLHIPFYAPSNAVIVLHNADYAVQQARCST